MKRAVCLWGAVGEVALLSCASPNEPVPTDGRIVLRIVSGPTVATTRSDAPASTLAAATFDSVVVRVFRGGGSIVQETAKGVAMTDSIEVSLACIAESHKRVSVDLFDNRVMTYHGANTNVNVLANRRTDVAVDAYEFLVDTLEVSPMMVPDGSSCSLRWNAAAAATWYQVQSSPTSDFASIEWEQTVTDTVLDRQSPPGSHYFRVIPRTSFARGTAAGPEFTYVFGSSGSVTISGFNPAE